MKRVHQRDFIPDVIWPFDTETDTCGTAVDRKVTPGKWSELVSADIPLVTQWDDGAHTGPEPGSLASSSASMPGVVATMLAALAPREGQAILDIGTGTGYTAALIAEAVGPAGFVTTLEVDPAVAAAARSNLERAGIANAEVVTGDGFEGWAARGPYDAVHVTCGIRRISPAWVGQCRPGARIVLPWGTDYTQHDRLLTLTVHGDGSASGGEHGRRSDSDLTRSEAQEVIGHDGGFAVGLRVPDCFVDPASTGEDAVALWLYSTRDRSVAYAGFRDGHAPDIAEAGPRSLWTEAAHARAWWVRHGRPGPERFGLTVTATGTRAWLDRPDGESWAL
ncbi:methyltransferase domain-containing protein [Yinghuangia soli]|uniref:Protein-L-isoaspartate O-methyltransferase n=1 Tax=Yinghuangia soli TaxID=2908204 RepID=A0AA41PWC9_9ACTN|nr:methyltransferase domain-containing protein [Yinghuangia soli]MCF2526550.1 methyltransferase domain-containing protein [Yinghuangia soli]